MQRTPLPCGYLEVKYLLDKFPNASYDFFTKINNAIDQFVAEYMANKDYKFTGRVLVNKSNGFVSAQLSAENDNILTYIPLGVLLKPEEYTRYGN